MESSSAKMAVEVEAPKLDCRVAGANALDVAVVAMTTAKDNAVFENFIVLYYVDDQEIR